MDKKRQADLDARITETIIGAENSIEQSHRVEDQIDATIKDKQPTAISGVVHVEGVDESDETE